MSGHKKQTPAELCEALIREAYREVISHPMFKPFSDGFGSGASLLVGTSKHVTPPTPLRLTVTPFGQIHARPIPGWSKAQWVHGLASCILHLGLGHGAYAPPWTRERHVAAWLDVTRLLSGLKLTSEQPLQGFLASLPSGAMASMEDWLGTNGIPDPLISLLPYPSLSLFHPLEERQRPYAYFKTPNFVSLFETGVQNALEAALDVASGRRDSLTSPRAADGVGNQAKAWILAHYPLLASVASHFTIVESIEAARQRQVDVGMIDLSEKKVYLNPLAGLSKDEWVWVLAHEYLHAGLNHGRRQDGRDGPLWNVACDFAINDWLDRLRLGQRPSIGVLFDSQFRGWSAERIYEHITTRIRTYRKWSTFAGFQKQDFRGHMDGQDTDAERYCREALVQGFFKHQSVCRGLFPADMEEAIRALQQPVLPWNVLLGQWMDLHVAFPERRRTYMRQSRRQSAAPDTPLPRQVIREEFKSNAHTFGVVLDTSGSMSRTLLAKCLGVITQYALSHEVPGVRIVFCDAQPYDIGYVSPDDLLSQPLLVKGRGGTELASAVKHLHAAEDFPDDAPILILTDGFTDVFEVPRNHAYVLPRGHRLPFTSKGDVFYAS